MNQGGASIKMSSTAVKGQMKGLLKGLRYISQMFDEEEEKEIQIGFPTDVKHLAHIGCEDAKANAPSWMTEFKETPSPGAKTSEGQDSGNNSDSNNNIKGDGKRSHIRRSRNRSSDSQSSTTSPPREDGTTKPTRRHHSSESSRRSSRQSSTIEEEENNKPPKQSHRRKTKTTSEDKDKEPSSSSSSTRRPSRTRRSSKADSLTDISFTDLGPGPGSGSAVQ